MIETVLTGCSKVVTSHEFWPDTQTWRVLNILFFEGMSMQKILLELVECIKIILSAHIEGLVPVGHLFYGLCTQHFHSKG